MSDARLVEKSYAVLRALSSELNELQQRCFELESKVNALRDEIEDHWQNQDAPLPDRRGIQ